MLYPTSIEARHTHRYKHVRPPSQTAAEAQARTAGWVQGAIDTLCACRGWLPILVSNNRDAEASLPLQRGPLLPDLLRGGSQG